MDENIEDFGRWPQNIQRFLKLITKFSMVSEVFQIYPELLQRFQKLTRTFPKISKVCLKTSKVDTKNLERVLGLTLVVFQRFPTLARRVSKVPEVNKNRGAIKAVLRDFVEYTNNS